MQRPATGSSAKQASPLRFFHEPERPAITVVTDNYYDASERDGELQHDEFEVELAVVFVVKEKGLVMLSGCTHADERRSREGGEAPFPPISPAETARP